MFKVEEINYWAQKEKKQRKTKQLMMSTRVCLADLASHISFLS